MASPERNRVLVTAVAASTAVLVLLVLLVSASTGSRVADNAARLQWTNATLGTAALARLAAGQAATFEHLTEADVVPAGALALADSELADVTEALDELVAAAPDESAESVEGLSEFVDLLASRPVEMDPIDAAFAEQAAGLRAELAEIQNEIEVSQSSFGRVSALLRIIVVLILPVSAIVVYRRRAIRQFEAARVQMEAQVEAEREVTRAKDQFIAGMSHEIRTPLTAIHGFSEILIDSPPDISVDREIVTVINNESGELGRMVDDFIAASRLDGPGIDVELVPTDLAEVAAQTVDRFRRRGVSIPIRGTSPLALADAGRTRQVLVNLVSNAIHHGADPISIVLDAEGDTVSCTVIDHGPGVTKEMRERLYSRFIHQGTDVLLTGTLGLGTWVAREFARAMGGTVTDRRVEDETHFTLSLPASRVQVASSQATTEIGQLAAGSAS